MDKILYNRHETAAALARELSDASGRLRDVGDRIDMQEKWKTLRFLSFFKDFNDDQITEVVNASEWKDYEKDEIIVTEGETETAFYIITKGSVSVVKEDASSATWNRVTVSEKSPSSRGVHELPPLRQNRCFSDGSECLADGECLQ